MIIERSDLFPFLKESMEKGRRVTALESKQIATDYLFTEQFKDEDFQYFPPNLLPGLLDLFIYVSSYGFKEENDWNRKFDNLVSIIKSKNLDLNADLSHFKLYEAIKYEPLFNYIVEYFQKNKFSSFANRKLADITKYYPFLFKRLVLIDGLVPKPWTPLQQKLYQAAYDEVIHNSIVDTTIGLHSLGLPSLVVENIANYTVDTSTTGIDVYNLVKSVNESNRK